MTASAPNWSIRPAGKILLDVTKGGELAKNMFRIRTMASQRICRGTAQDPGSANIGDSVSGINYLDSKSGTKRSEAHSAGHVSITSTDAPHQNRSNPLILAIRFSEGTERVDGNKARVAAILVPPWTFRPRC